MADHTAASHSMDPEKDANIPELAQNNSNLPESSRFHEPDLEKGELPGSAPSPPLSYDEPKKNPDLVNWEGPHDPENPRNFSRMRKWYITMMLSLLTFCITFSSSVFSQATAVTAKIYGVSVEVTTLGTALIVLIPVAVAQNLATILICRFLIGAFGSVTLAVVGGALVDLWEPVDRGIAAAGFCAATFLGPIAGPIIGGFIVPSHLGWRWTNWITLILDAAVGLVALFSLPETFAPVILQNRAKRLRYETKNWALHSTLDESPLTINDIFHKYLSRPFEMLILEPILSLTTIYLSVVYGILYLFFFAYPISFGEVRGWEHPGVAALPFIGLLIGILLGCAVLIYISKHQYAQKLRETGNLVPEDRLPPMIFAAFTLPAGLFWFAWTSSPHITWVPQVIAGVPIGFGLIIIFLQGINYVVDVYLIYANSALAANTFIRSLLGAAFPMFASQMYHNLGVAWASSVLAFITLAMIPVPILFYVYGARIRAMSRFVPKV
ncbi:MFS multidrug transporter, putative [Trichophyton benhamiae CBS 112371]|uniref:MFS multidrug transporter, putative n=1 Tax=Arthroderma benhamiae (strain ATCC MYA-4681 / CBS 112371) TaxID=663331 RepID=D4B490_ARTBC|nr:MFS multidrug transporter, putative [Trichophyton benhamiae CBS 112371]EFE29938.1 MFS multidrug transporter, putative [Trichophyton benhamiae CBS 112371]